MILRVYIVTIIFILFPNVFNTPTCNIHICTTTNTYSIYSEIIIFKSAFYIKNAASL